VFSDLHLGHKLSSQNHFQSNLIDRYKDDKEAWFIDLGDCCDMIVAQTGDRRFQPDMIDHSYVGVHNPVDRMIDDYCELVWPIRDRIICLADSNHHLEIERRTGTSPTRRIAEKLWGVNEAHNRMIGYAGFLVTRFNYESKDPTVRNSQVKTLVWSLCHGIGTGGKTEGGFKTTIGNDAINYDADVFCYAHNHQLGGWNRIVLGVDHYANKVVSRKKVRINSGSYMKGFSDDSSTSYVEAKRMKPNALGHMEFNVRLSRNGLETYYVERMVL
jgi:hypothetical protein